MIDVFINVILPVFLVAVIAGLFQRWRNVPASSVSQVTLYILAPALIFESLIEQEMPATASVGIIVTVLIGTILLISSSYVISKIMGQENDMRSAFVLSTAFPNAGNLALPVLLLAFGDEALAVGIVIFVTQATLGNSFGVFVAANSTMNILSAVKQIFKLPAIYATILAVIVRVFDMDLPNLVNEPISLLARSAIPMMLVVLGLQFSGKIGLENPFSLSTAILIRLIFSVPLMYGVSSVFGLSPLAQGVVIVVYAMPVAVFTTILATEFNTHPKFVTNAVVISTVLSTLTLTLVIQVSKGLIN